MLFLATEARRARESSACFALRSEGGTSDETSCCSISGYQHPPERPSRSNIEHEGKWEGRKYSPLT